MSSKMSSKDKPPEPRRGEVVASTGRPWQHRWYDICSDCAVTVPSFVMCLWPFLLPTIASKVGHFPAGGTRRRFAVVIICLVSIVIAFEAASILTAGVCETTQQSPSCGVLYLTEALAAVCSLLLCLIVHSLRRHVQKLSNIMPICSCCTTSGDAEEAIFTYFCTSCSIMQLGREVDVGDEIVYCTIPEVREVPVQGLHL